MQKKISSSILRYFFEVARTGSLRAAASSLHIATSAISRQISNLEEMLGASLFNRGPQGMTLSEPGKILADFTIDLFQRESALIDQINAAVGAGSGLIKIASTEEFASHFLPQAIRTFMNANPDSRFDICIGKAVHVSQMVEDGNADLGLSISLPGPASNHMEYSEPSTVSVVIPAGHALTGRPTLSIADLYLHPFAVVNGDAMLSELLQRSFARERMMFNPLLSVTRCCRSKPSFSIAARLPCWIIFRHTICCRRWMPLPSNCKRPNCMDSASRCNPCMRENCRKRCAISATR